MVGLISLVSGWRRLWANTENGAGCCGAPVFVVTERKICSYHVGSLPPLKAAVLGFKTLLGRTQRLTQVSHAMIPERKLGEQHYFLSKPIHLRSQDSDNKEKDTIHGFAN